MFSSKGNAGTANSKKKLVKMMLLIGLVVLVVAIGLYVFHAMASRNSKERFKDMVGGCSDAKYVLIYFYMDQCPHCIRFRPEWDKCIKTINGGKFDGKVCLREYSADVRDMCTKYNVDGFPTVIWEDVQSGSRVAYDGPRTVDGIIGFISEHTSG